VSVVFLLISVETLPVGCWLPSLKLLSHLGRGDSSSVVFNSARIPARGTVVLLFLRYDKNNSK